MSKEHLGLALSLGIPVFVVITKIDRCPAHVLEKTVKELTSILKSKSCRKIPLFIENNHDVVTTAVIFLLSGTFVTHSLIFCSKISSASVCVPFSRSVMSQVKVSIWFATF